MEKPQFAYTGPSPAQGYVGFVNIQETDDGVRFTVRSEGDNPPYAQYVVDRASAVKLLRDALDGIEQALPKPPAPGSNEWWTVRAVAHGDVREPWFALSDEDRAALTAR